MCACRGAAPKPVLRVLPVFVGLTTCGCTVALSTGLPKGLWGDVGVFTLHSLRNRLGGINGLGRKKLSGGINPCSHY